MAGRSSKASGSHYISAVGNHLELPPPKKQKAVKAVPIPSSVLVTLSNEQGERAGPQVELPASSTPKQLEALVNSLLAQTDGALPYAFYVNDVEVTSSLQETLAALAETAAAAATAGDAEGAAAATINYEETISVSYQPLSVFRVRPVTRCIETMPGHTDAVLHVSYSPDGRRLASGGGDKAVRFWNVQTNMPQFTCLGHRHHVLCTAWSPDGKTFVSVDRAGEIRQWDPKTGQQRGAALQGHTKWVTALAFEPLHVDGTCRRLATSSKDHTIKIWDLALGTCETTISGHTDSVECVKWGGTGLLYTASRDRTIKVWAVDGSGRSQQKLVRTLTGHAHRINTLALNCDYVLRTGASELSLSFSFSSSSSSSSSSAAAPAADELKAKALARYLAVVGMSAMPTGGEGATGERLVSGSDDFTMFLWSPQEGKTSTRLTGHQQMINHVLFSPDARFLASASFDKKVKLWCGKTGRFLATLNGHVASVYQVAWSADSAFLVSASKDSTIKLWSTKDTKKAIHTLPGHEDEVYSVDWSPNGTSVASGSKDRTIKIWRS